MMKQVGDIVCVHFYGFRKKTFAYLFGNGLYKSACYWFVCFTSMFLWFLVIFMLYISIKITK